MNAMTFLKGAALGAGFMYLFDPSQGRRRRARIRDGAVRAWNDAGDAVEAKTHDLANRAQGVLHDATAILTPGGASKLSTHGAPAALMPSNWSPTTRLLVTAAAGVIALYGKRRGDMFGTALGALSVGLITNTINLRELRGGVISSPSLPSDLDTSEDTAVYDRADQEHRPRATRGY